MAEKFSIYAGEPMAIILAGHEENRSARINQVCRDFLTSVADVVPEMAQAEWSAVVDATNGMFGADRDTYRFMWAEVADFDGLGEKWGIDQQALAARIRGLSIPELIAVAEVSRRFWALSSPDPAAQALRAAGARITIVK